MRYPFIAFEGNIGVGKTTISKIIAPQLGADLLLEKFRKNYFLPLFYSNMKKYGLHVELSFLLDRLDDFTSYSEHPKVVSDYLFTKTLLFAKKNLDAHAFRIFEMVYKRFEQQARKPDMIVYLRRDMNQIISQIKDRGRKSEMGIKKSYLESIQSAYDDHMSSVRACPVLWLEIGEADFKKNSSHVQLLVGLLDRPYKNGVTRITL